MNLHLGFGYVESQSNSVLHISRSEDGFETVEDALGRFLTDAVAVMRIRNSTEDQEPRICVSPICSAKGRRVVSPFCGRCGVPTQIPQDFSREEICTFIESLGGDNDSVGGETWQAFQDRGWELGNIAEGEVLDVSAAEYYFRGHYGDNKNSDRYEGVATVNRYRVSDFQEDVVLPPSSWVDQVLAQTVDSP